MKALFAALLAVASTLAMAQTPPPAAAPAAPQVDPRIKQAQQLNSEGKQDEALAILQPMLAANPKDFDANLTTGIVLDLKGNYDEAHKRFKQAIEVAPQARQIQAWRTTAVSYAFTCDMPHVLDNERQAYEAQMGAGKQQDAAGIANELARIYLECGDTENASQWYQTGYTTARRDTKLTEAEHDLWEYRYQSAKARLAARKGKNFEAMEDTKFTKALLDAGKLPANQAIFYPYVAGYVAFYGGDYKTAIEQLKQADQKDPFILALLGQAYEKSGDKETAMSLYRQVLTINSHNPTNAFARPFAKKKLGLVN